jgi:hypothetical protein
LVCRSFENSQKPFFEAFNKKKQSRKKKDEKRNFAKYKKKLFLTFVVEPREKSKELEEFLEE